MSLVAERGGDEAMRETPHTAATVTAISDGHRAAMVVFLRDGVIDEGEMTVIRAMRQAVAEALRADWARRARQSVENNGRIGPRLLRELREMDAEYPLDAA